MKAWVWIAAVGTLLLMKTSTTRADVNVRTGFEADEGYQVGKLTNSNQPNPVGDIGWGVNQWVDFGGNHADPNGQVVAPGDARQGTQYYQRLGGAAGDLAARQFPDIAAGDGNFSISWLVRVDTDQAQPTYFGDFATIEMDDAGPGGRIMTLRYDLLGNINLDGGIASGIAKWDGTGDPSLASALNQFARGGLNVDWSTRQIEVFHENITGGLTSLGTYGFREFGTDRVNRLFLGVGPAGSAEQGVSWDDIVMSSDLLVEQNGTVLLGDVNLDGEVNGLDVSPFVDRVTAGQFQVEADMNQDLAVDGLDVAPFVEAVVGGRLEVVPEPSAWLLAGLGGILLASLRRRCRASGHDDPVRQRRSDTG